MALITEYRTPATPDYGAVEIADANTGITDDDALKTARSQVVAGGSQHLYLYSLQREIDVEVVIRIWDAPQPCPADAEGVVSVTLRSDAGALEINQFTYGPAGEMTLPRPGVYEGRASWNGRQETADYCDMCHERSVEEEWDLPRLRQARRQCPVQEQYVIDLWFRD
ncbi:hypothetical protein LRS74_20945 [Streptomyces sp. LX-29]|uniref:hypothetical protein n=1 Tax=Streptomyces sp. LX-29 TaxID=2900152 RepID=UPI00240E2C70|nr:hypothetical protein [Streptomyces sp. LX-29]WFB09228.1 hypothetical protein LRS74_20945 [Streptomyces sp. LX-29]